MCARDISLRDARRGCQGLDCRPSLLSSTEGNGTSLCLRLVLIYHLYLPHWWTGRTCSIQLTYLFGSITRGLTFWGEKICYFHRSKGWRNNYMFNLVNLFIFYELAPSCFADFSSVWPYLIWRLCSCGTLRHIACVCLVLLGTRSVVSLSPLGDLNGAVI